MSNVFDYLEALCNLDGVSGCEFLVSEYLQKHYEQLGYITYKDGIGNLICHLPMDSNKKNIALVSHMDEVGFIVKKIEENGLLRVQNVGGIFSQTLLCQALKVYSSDLSSSYRGVFLAPAIHQMTTQQQSQVIKIDDMYVDLGVSSKKAVLDLGVNIGSMIAFDSQYQRNFDVVMAKAIDDRYGCALMAHFATCKQTYSNCNLIHVFTVQEEVGLRGASTLSSLNIDLAIVLDASASSDIVEKQMDFGKLHDGVLIRHYDPGLITNQSLINRMINCCEKHKIKYQSFFSMGSTDAAKIQILNNGIQTIVLGVCLRNIHTSKVVASVSDIQEAVRLLPYLILEFEKTFY